MDFAIILLLYLPWMYTNEFRLLNPESEVILVVHHFNVCGGEYINYCYHYINFTYCSNYYFYRHNCHDHHEDNVLGEQ
jgi:hypothetical protein